MSGNALKCVRHYHLELPGPTRKCRVEAAMMGQPGSVLVLAATLLG